MRITKVLIGVVILASIAGLLTWAFVEGRGELARERELERPVKVPPRVTQVGGQIIVTLDRAMQERIGLKTEPLAGLRLQPEVVAYGWLQEDPAQSFTLRAPLAGALCARQHSPADHRTGPGIGETLADGAVVAALQPRLGPVERLDLAVRLVSARADVEAIHAALAAAQTSCENKKALNVAQRIVADRMLEEAEAKVKAEEARLAGAEETVRLIERVLATSDAAADVVPLTLARGGEVVELLAQPGETVEAGQPILRVARFEQLLVRVDVPAGETITEPPLEGRIVPLGHEDTFLRGELAGPAPALDLRTQGQGYLFRVTVPAAAHGVTLRPGLAVTAYLPTPGPAQDGVVVPFSAIVRLSGRTWVYVQLTEDKFTRREVPAGRSTASGWFVPTEGSAGAGPGLRAGGYVVTTGGQTLLSEEFKSQIQVGEEGEGGGERE